MTLNWRVRRIENEVADDSLPRKMRGINMKKSNSMNRKVLTALTGVGLLFLVGTSQATVFEIDFSNAGTFSGTAPSLPVSPSTVYAKAIFDDHGSSGSITLTMSVLSGLLPTGAYASDWYFNSITAPLTHISYFSGDQANYVDNGTNAFKADTTIRNFDFAFHFRNHNHDISAGETSVYTLTDLGLKANSFRSFSVPSRSGESENEDGYHHQNFIGGGFLGAIQLQSYGLMHDDDHGKSAWISGNELVSHAPEPESYAMFLAELGLMGFIARRRTII